jgi:hypothetical protein
MPGITAATVTANSTGVLVTSGTIPPRPVIIKVPVGGADVYVGGTAANSLAGGGGFLVIAGESFSFDLEPQESIYVSTAATQTVYTITGRS